MTPQLGETVVNGLQAPNNVSHLVNSSAMGTLSHDSQGQKDASVDDVHGTVGGSDGVITHHDIAPSAIQPEDGESGEEVGAFDDSHLQVDQEKKKRKKKGKKKSKSKRGLVCFGS